MVRCLAQDQKIVNRVRGVESVQDFSVLSHSVSEPTELSLRLCGVKEGSKNLWKCNHYEERSEVFRSVLFLWFNHEHISSADIRETHISARNQWFWKISCVTFEVVHKMGLEVNKVCAIQLVLTGARWGVNITRLLAVTRSHRQPKVSISLWVCASGGGLCAPTQLAGVSLHPEWMTAGNWRGPFLRADTADLNIKTWCKTVIKSQLQLVSMKSQLSVSGAVNGGFFFW